MSTLTVGIDPPSRCTAGPGAPQPRRGTQAAGPTRSRSWPAALRPASRACSGRVRLTRRGRALIGVAAAGFALLGVIGGRAGAQAVAPPVADPAAASVAVTVGPGETLWTIARSVAPDEDPRAVIARIVEVNGLTDTGLLAGQELLVPRPRGDR